MEPFGRHCGRAVALLRRDIDTDQIVPKEFLKRIERTGFGRFLFHDWRMRPDGSAIPDFVLNQPRAAGASILIAGANFGCGSSREHAAWALADFGFRAIIAPSFADIFRGNALANGLLPVVLRDEIVDTLARRAEVPGYEMTIDLEALTVQDDHGLHESFALEPSARHRLLHGLDDIGLILQHEDAIDRFERSHFV